MAEKHTHSPGPWSVGYEAADVGCVNARIGGFAKLFVVRGWGYLTGHGHGGLGLDIHDAYEIQKANARLAAAAPAPSQAAADVLDARATALHKSVLRLLRSGHRMAVKEISEAIGTQDDKKVANVLDYLVRKNRAMRIDRGIYQLTAVEIERLDRQSGEG